MGPLPCTSTMPRSSKTKSSDSSSCVPSATCIFPGAPVDSMEGLPARIAGRDRIDCHDVPVIGIGEKRVLVLSNAVADIGKIRSVADPVVIVTNESDEFREGRGKFRLRECKQAERVSSVVRH